MKREFNLNERLIDFSVVVLKIAEKFPKTVAGNHIAGQIVRSGSAPALHYGEAQGGESPKDFIHKMKVALKELRETYNALRIARRMTWLPYEEFEWVVDENNQLISIFFKSIQTAQKNYVEEKNKKKDNKEVE